MCDHVNLLGDCPDSDVPITAAATRLIQKRIHVALNIYINIFFFSLNIYENVGGD